MTRSGNGGVARPSAGSNRFRPRLEPLEKRIVPGVLATTLDNRSVGALVVDSANVYWGELGSHDGTLPGLVRSVPKTGGATHGLVQDRFDYRFDLTQDIGSLYFTDSQDSVWQVDKNTGSFSKVAQLGPTTLGRGPFALNSSSFSKRTTWPLIQSPGPDTLSGPTVAEPTTLVTAILDLRTWMSPPDLSRP